MKREKDGKRDQRRSADEARRHEIEIAFCPARTDAPPPAETAVLLRAQVAASSLSPNIPDADDIQQDHNPPIGRTTLVQSLPEAAELPVFEKQQHSPDHPMCSHRRSELQPPAVSNQQPAMMPTSSIGVDEFQTGTGPESDPGCVELRVLSEHPDPFTVPAPQPAFPPPGYPLNADPLYQRAGELLLRDMMGFRDIEQQKVPEGFAVGINDRGQRFLMKHGEEHLEEPEEQKKIPVFANNNLLADYFGNGVVLYFHFLNFVIKTNVYLVLVALIGFVPHIMFDYVFPKEWMKYGLDSSSGGNIFNVLINTVKSERRILYLSSYSESVHYYWLCSVVLAGLGMLVCGLLYTRSVKRYFARRSIKDHEDAWEVANEDIIPQNKDLPLKSRAWRVIISYSLFLVMLSLSAFSTYIFTCLELAWLGSRVASFGLAVLVTLIRMIWSSIVLSLTKLERHRTWALFKKNVLFKTFTFKVASLLVVYIFRWLVPAYNLIPSFIPRSKNTVDGTKTPQEIIEDKCGLVALGDQFLMFLVVDILATNLVEFGPSVLKWVSFWFCGCWCCVKKKTHPDKVEFDIADEYLEILYRQFIVYLGFPYFPLITLLGLLGNLLEVVIDRYRLVRLCKKPPRLHGSMKTQNTWFLFLNAAFAIAAFPRGIGWVAAGWGFGPNVCPVSIFTTPSVSD